MPWPFPDALARAWAERRRRWQAGRSGTPRRTSRWSGRNDLPGDESRWTPWRWSIARVAWPRGARSPRRERRRHRGSAGSRRLRLSALPVCRGGEARLPRRRPRLAEVSWRTASKRLPCSSRPAPQSFDAAGQGFIGLGKSREVAAQLASCEVARLELEDAGAPNGPSCDEAVSLQPAERALDARERHPEEPSELPGKALLEEMKREEYASPRDSAEGAGDSYDHD